MGANPVFRIFWFVQRLRVVSSSNLESRISGSLPNMRNRQRFSKIFSTWARYHFWRDMGANPVFRTFLFEVLRWWNLVCRYSMWPRVWMSGQFSALGLFFFFCANPVFRTFWFVQRLWVVWSSNLESKISDSLRNMWNHQMFQNSIVSTGAWSFLARYGCKPVNPVFRTFLFEVVRQWNLVCSYSM
jgi:hypothetical protein